MLGILYDTSFLLTTPRLSLSSLQTQAWGRGSVDEYLLSICKGPGFHPQHSKKEKNLPRIPVKVFFTLAFKDLYRLNWTGLYLPFFTSSHLGPCYPEAILVLGPAKFFFLCLKHRPYLQGCSLLRPALTTLVLHSPGILLSTYCTHHLLSTV